MPYPSLARCAVNLRQQPACRRSDLTASLAIWPSDVICLVHSHNSKGRAPKLRASREASPAAGGGACWRR